MILPEAVGRRIVGSSVILLSLLISCAPRRAEIALDTSAVDSGTLIAMVREHAGRVQTLEGSGAVTFESPEFGGSAAFELSLRKPDSLLVLLEGPFGIDVGTLFLNGNNYLVYDPGQNSVTRGSSLSSALLSFLPFDLTADQIMNAFAGSFALPDEADGVRTYTVDDGQFLLSVDCGGNICTYWIDNRYLQVTRFELTGRNGDLLLQAKASSFADDGDASVPKRIMIWFPDEEKQVSVLYTSVSINPPNPSFSYSIPSDARVRDR